MLGPRTGLNLKRGSAPTGLLVAPIVLCMASDNLVGRYAQNEVHMNKSDCCNSPKGAANDAHKQGPAKDSPATKQKTQPITSPAKPVTSKPTEKGNK